jgi:redox-sensing transcriptional repressor
MPKIAESAVRRLSLYLRSLEEFEEQGTETVSSETLAARGGTTSAQVRKDLSFFGSFGKRGLGYSVRELVLRLRDILGLRRTYRVAVIGAGQMGSALAQYRGFTQRGFHIAAVYDSDTAKAGKMSDGLRVRHANDLEQDLAREPMDIAIIVTPAAGAQTMADRLVRSGVRAILNFAPVRLDVPDTVIVKNVNMALELEALSFALRNQ